MGRQSWTCPVENLCKAGAPKFANSFLAARVYYEQVIGDHSQWAVRALSLWSGLKTLTDNVYGSQVIQKRMSFIVCPYGRRGISVLPAVGPLPSTGSVSICGNAGQFRCELKR